MEILHFILGCIGACIALWLIDKFWRDLPARKQEERIIELLERILKRLDDLR